MMTPLLFSLVPMQHWHLHEVHTIDTLVYPRAWSVALLRQELAMRDTRYYVVIEIDRRVVAHAGIMYVAGEGHVTTVAVHPDWQGHGLASHAMVALCRDAIERKISALTLEVRVGNERAIALYRRFGFAPAGVRKNYYAETGEDALIMWAHDIEQPAYEARLSGIERDLFERDHFVNGRASDNNDRASDDQTEDN